LSWVTKKFGLMSALDQWDDILTQNIKLAQKRGMLESRLRLDRRIRNPDLHVRWYNT
jgi:hypothetical protein